MNITEIYYRSHRSSIIVGCFMMVICLFLTSCGSSHQPVTSQTQAATSVSNDTLSAEQQRKFDYFYLEALRLKGNKDYDAAFDMIQHCLRIYPQSAAALFELGQYYISLDKTAQGVNAIEKAAAIEPDNYWFSQALANLYQQQGDSIKAVNILEKMAVHFPSRQDILLNLVELYSQQNQYQKVIQVLNQLEKVMGKNEQISMEKFKTYLMMNDSKKAFNEIESLVREYPLDTRYQVILGDVYLQHNKKEEAYNIYQKVLASEPDNAMALYSMASYYNAIGNKDMYEQQLDTFLLNKKVPAETKVDVMKQLISQYEQENRDSTKIIRLFDRIIKEDAEDTQIPMLYANYLVAKGMNEASLPILEHIVALDPSNVAARLMILSAAIKKEDYKKVIQICEPGIEATPDALELYFYLAIAYNQAERYNDALAISRKALTHVKDDTKKDIVSDFYAIIGDALHTQNKNTEAFAAYDSSLVNNPDNVGALNNYAYYLSVERKQLDKAEEMSYKTVKAEPKNSTYLDTYAWILFIKGNYTQARIYIDTAMKNGGSDDNTITEHCGDIYYMTGDKEDALKYWQKSESLGNKSKTLKQKIAKKKYISE